MMYFICIYIIYTFIYIYILLASSGRVRRGCLVFQTGGHIEPENKDQPRIMHH